MDYPKIKFIVPRTDKDGSFEINAEDILPIEKSRPAAANSNLLGIKVGSRNDRAIQIRKGYDLDKKALYLEDCFDWKIVRDSSGSLCLIAIKK